MPVTASPIGIRAWIVLFAAVLALVPSSRDSTAQSSDAGGAPPFHALPDIAAVAELLEVTGVFTASRTDTQQLVRGLQAQNPAIPLEVWVNFTQRMTARAQLEKLYVPVYARHLSASDVRDIDEFMRSPLGSRWRSARPLIQAEYRQAAQSWATRTALEIVGETLGTAQPAAAAGGPLRPAADLPLQRMAAIHDLLRLSGALAGQRQFIESTFDQLRKGAQANRLPVAAWAEARKRLDNEAALLDLWTVAFAHHLDEADIRGLNNFYRSAAGMCYVAALSKIQSESTSAGVQMARDAMRHAMRDELGPLPQWRLLHPPREQPRSLQ
jgi:hypothetical protein